MSDVEMGYETPRDPEPNHELPQALPEPSGYLWHPIERPVPPL